MPRGNVTTTHQAATRKLEDNARKYPAERVRGQGLKYDEYD